MAQERVGGIIQVQVNGEVYKAKGDFTYNLGRGKREAILGVDAVHGYKEMPQVPFIEGEFTDGSALNVNSLLELTGATVTLSAANGKVVSLFDAYFASEGTVNTGEGNIGVRFEGSRAEEVA